MTNGEEQLELFSLQGQASASRSYREIPRRWSLQLRHEHVMLGGIASLIGIAIVFAFGVERGKQLVRAEHVAVARQSAQLPSLANAQKVLTPVAEQKTVVPQPAVADKALKEPSVKTPEKVKQPRKLAESSASRFAIQVVTYSKPSLASLEVQRLHARGERAFLLKRNGRTAVFVGPFPSQAHASEKLTGLKPRYQDCFVKTL